MSYDEAKAFFPMSVMEIIKREKTLKETENEMQELFKKAKVGDVLFFDKLSDAMRNRKRSSLPKSFLISRMSKEKRWTTVPEGGKVAQGIKGNALGLDIEEGTKSAISSIRR